MAAPEESDAVKAARSLRVTYCKHEVGVTPTPANPFSGHFPTTAGEHTQEEDTFVVFCSAKTISHASNGPSIPQLLHQICNDGEVSSLDRREALQQLVRASTGNDNSIGTKVCSLAF